MNTNGGIIILGIKESNRSPQKLYELKGYKDDFEAALKLFKNKFTDKDFLHGLNDLRMKRSGCIPNSILFALCEPGAGHQSKAWGGG